MILLWGPNPCKHPAADEAELNNRLMGFLGGTDAEFSVDK